MPINSFIDYPMSWKPDKKELKRPIYLSLATALERDINSGKLLPGTKMPPQRELADFLDINFTTITRTYKLCEMKGLLFAEVGRGTFVSPTAARSATISADNSVGSTIDLAFVGFFEQCNFMAEGAIKKVATKPYLEKLLNYNEPSGMRHQKQVAIEWMKQFGINAGENNLAITSGAMNALALTLISLFNAGDKIAVDVFTFSNFIELAKMENIQLVPIENDFEGMDPDALEMQCKLNNIKGIFLMPSCCNPTTIMISERRKKELARVINKYELILIEDDILAFLTANNIPDYKGPLSRFVPERSVYICSASKALCSGLRIAYIVFSEKLRTPLLKAIYNVNVKTSSLNAEIITELIVSGKDKEIISKKTELARKTNELFSTYFPETKNIGNPLSFYRWLPISKKYSLQSTEDEFLKYGVQVFHSSRFSSGSVNSTPHFRIALSTVNSIETLETGLKILKSHLD